MLWLLLETAKKNSEQPQRLYQTNWKEFVKGCFQKNISDKFADKEVLEELEGSFCKKEGYKCIRWIGISWRMLQKDISW